MVLMNFDAQLSLESGCLIEPKVVMLKFQYQLTMKVSDMIGQYVYLLPNWVIVALTPNIQTSGTPLRAYDRNRGFLICRRSTIVTIRCKSLSSSAIRVRRARTVLCMESRSYALASKNSHIKTTTTTTTTCFDDAIMLQ